MVQFEQSIHNCHQTQNICQAMQTNTLHSCIIICQQCLVSEDETKLHKNFTKMITNPSMNSGSIVISAVLFLLIHDASAIYPGV